MPSFARLPISLTISLSQFNSLVRLISCLHIHNILPSVQVRVTPPPPTSTVPVVIIEIPPTFQLDITTTSLMGSRAKLANVPKLHELIQHQLRRLLAARGTWNIVLPGLAGAAESPGEIVEDVIKDELAA